MARFDHPHTADLSLERVLQALSDPVRLHMVRRLATEGELTCSALGADRPKSSMSHHFRTLRDAGVIRTRTEGVVHFNGLRVADLDARFPDLLKTVVRSIPAPAGDEAHARQPAAEADTEAYRDDQRLSSGLETTDVEAAPKQRRRQHG